MTRSYDITDQDRYDAALDAAADLVLRITTIQREGAMQGAQEVVDDLVAKVHWLLDTFNLWSEDGTFAFPDGDIWHRKSDGFATESQLEGPWLDADNAAT